MLLRIEWTYVQPKQNIKTTFSSDPLPIEEAMTIAEDLEKLGRVHSLTFYDEHETSWTLKQLKKYVTLREEEPYELVAYFDGGFDVETKTAGIGAVVYFKQNRKRYRIRTNRQIELIGSNNEAEYAAVMLVLDLIEQLNVTRQSIHIYGDSLVVVQQMNGEWPCYEDELLRWIDRIENKAQRLQLQLTFHALSRKNNREADQLATQALQGIEIDSKLEIQ